MRAQAREKCFGREWKRVEAHAGRISAAGASMPTTNFEQRCFPQFEMPDAGVTVSPAYRERLEDLTEAVECSR